MARCPSCNKYVSLDAADPDILQDLELNEDTLVGEVRLALCCEECGEELLEYTFEIDADVEEFTKAHTHGDIVVKEDTEATERVDYVSPKTGKPMKNGTQMRGIEVNFTLICEHCKEEYVGDWSEEIPQANMEELY